MASFEEWLFSGTLDDITDKVASKNTYQTLMLSGLLRKLLLDGGNSLVHRVNAKHRLKIRFAITSVPLPNEPDLLFWGAMDGFSPETSRPGKAVVEVDLDGLLVQKILMHQGEAFTVAEVIRYLANVMGGVHSSRPEGRDLHLHGLATMGVGGAPVVVRSLVAVARVVHAGLVPLRRAVVAGDAQPSTSAGL